MGSTVWDDGLEYQHLEFMKREGGADTVAFVLENLIHQDYPQEDVDFVGTPFQDNARNAYAYMVVHSWKVSGELGSINISLPESPYADCEIDNMNSILSRLPKPFSGKFWGGVNDSDGFISWAAPIIMQRINCKESPDKDHVCPNEHIIVEPNHVALEVGTTKPARTLAHLQREYGLARWPYHYTFVMLRIRLERYKWRTATAEEVAEVLSATGSRLGSLENQGVTEKQ